MPVRSNTVFRRTYRGVVFFTFCACIQLAWSRVGCGRSSRHDGRSTWPSVTTRRPHIEAQRLTKDVSPPSSTLLLPSPPEVLFERLTGAVSSSIGVDPLGSSQVVSPEASTRATYRRRRNAQCTHSESEVVWVDRQTTRTGDTSNVSCDP